MWSSPLPALPEESERKKEGRNGGLVSPPAHLHLRSQTSVSWGCRLCVGGAQRWLGWPSAPAASSGDRRLLAALCYAVVAAGLDRPPLCPVSQHPVAKGRVEPVFPMAQPLLSVGCAVILSVTLALACHPHPCPIPHKGDCGQGSFSNKQPLLAL